VFYFVVKTDKSILALGHGDPTESAQSRCQCYKTFYSSSLTLEQNGWQFFRLVLHLRESLKFTYAEHLLVPHICVAFWLHLQILNKFVKTWQSQTLSPMLSRREKKVLYR
jgi:hypothetical protein